jgi:ABC-2 type transport system permease protein
MLPGLREAARATVLEFEGSDGQACTEPQRHHQPPTGEGRAAKRALMSRRLAAAGLSPRQVADFQSIRPPRQVIVGRVNDDGRAAAGFAVGIVLYLALTFAGSAIATTVATEKSTRISEVLLAVLRPSQVLVGTVLAVGTATLAQLLVLATPLAVAVQVTDKIGVPTVAAGDFGLAVAWFVLGFALYAFLFAAAAALVDKITEVSLAITPVIMILVAGYMLAVTVVRRTRTAAGASWRRCSH